MINERIKSIKKLQMTNTPGHHAETFRIFLLRTSAKSFAQHPVLPDEELAVTPLLSNRLQLVVPHVLDLGDDILHGKLYREFLT